MNSNDITRAAELLGQQAAKSMRVPTAKEFDAYLRKLDAVNREINPPLPPNPCWYANGIHHGTPRFHVGQRVRCRYADTPTRILDFISIISQVTYPCESNKTSGPSYSLIHDVPAGAKVAWYSESELRTLDTFVGAGDGI